MNNNKIEYYQLHIPFIINLMNILKPKTYLELGVSLGNNFCMANKICENCIGIDIIDQRINKVGNFYEMTTDEFFNINKKTFDFIFIDADHNYEQVKKDFLNSEKVLNKYGIIILHDTEPKDKKYLEKEYCGDSYKIYDYIEDLNDYDQITIPIDITGLTIVRRKKDKRFFQFI